MSTARMNEILTAVRSAAQLENITLPEASFVTYGEPILADEAVAVGFIQKVPDPVYDPDICGTIWSATFVVGIAYDLGEGWQGPVDENGVTIPESVDLINEKAEASTLVLEKALELIPESLSRTTAPNIGWDVEGDGRFLITTMTFSTGLT